MKHEPVHRGEEPTSPLARAYARAAETSLGGLGARPSVAVLEASVAEASRRLAALGLPTVEGRPR